MKEISSRFEGKNIVNRILKTIYIFIIIFGLALVVPGSYHRVYAAPLEDCDLDGFDDATGVPVPWPGYDETKGDTPDGPGGANISNIVPSTDNIYSTTDNTKNEISDKTDSNKSDSKNSTDTVKNNISKSENTSNTDSVKTGTTDEDKTESSNTKSSTSDNSSSTVNSQTDKTETDKKSSTVKANTGKVETGTTNNNAIDNSSKTEIGTTQTTAGKDSVKVSSVIINSTNSNDIEGDLDDESNGLEASVNNNQEKSTVIEAEQSEEDSDISDGAEVNITVDEFETIINTKGSLEIIEVDGSIIHAGSTLIISGSGFAGNVEVLELEVQSDSIPIGHISTSEDGAFEISFSLPLDLKAGVYKILVLYAGNEITSQEIEVGPKAADSFLQALSVGFSKDNQGLIPGILILLGLFVAGGGVLGVKALISIGGHSKS